MAQNKNILIVYAHPDPSSFNGSMYNVSVKVLKSKGYNVKVSELYSMQFKATTSKDDIIGSFNNQPFNYYTEARDALKEGRLSQDIVDEIEKLEWADLVIFQFPIQWFGMPSILKGWMDRVLVNGRIYSMKNLYSTGNFKGKRAVISVTTGGTEAMYKPSGINGDIHMTLWPIQNGILNFLGYDVLQPNICYAVNMMPVETRKQLIEDWTKRLDGLFDEKPMKFLTRDDFEAGGFGSIKDEVLKKACKAGTLPLGQRDAANHV